MTASADEIVSFWHQAGPDRWFTKDAAFDTEIRERFFDMYESAAAGKFSDWEKSAQGSLALVILLDQFPRNMFRGNARAFATDPLARAVADRAIARSFDKKTEKTLQQFFYLPFMHSESLADQDRCLQLYEALGDAEQLRFAIMHRDI